MDCEGCEYEILFELPKNILDRIKIVSMEFHSDLTEYNHNDLIEFFNANGFETKITKNDGAFGMMLCKNKRFFTLITNK